MNFKIDTKEKFHQITLLDPILSANMTDDITKMLFEFLDNPVKNVVLSFERVTGIDKEVAIKLAGIQHDFYESGNSFVICDLQPTVEETLESNELLETMNVTPTASEAWDIVQMEEIERELLNGF